MIDFFDNSLPDRFFLSRRFLKGSNSTRLKPFRPRRRNGLFYFFKTADSFFQIPMEERTKCVCYARVVGFIRPIKNWNESKAAEFKRRKAFNEKKAVKNKDLPFS